MVKEIQLLTFRGTFENTVRPASKPMDLFKSFNAVFLANIEQKAKQSHFWFITKASRPSRPELLL